MKRKEFLSTTAAVSLGTIAGCGNNRSESEALSSDTIETIGGKTLKELSKYYRDDLFNRFLPNMEKMVIDHEYGGFMVNVDSSTGKRITTDKGAWYEGRGIWLYSFLYTHIEKDARFLETARKSVDFILAQKPTDDSFWNASFNREGVPISGPGDIFGDLYIAEGLGVFAEASGQDQYYELAKEIIFKCIRRYDQPDYDYHVSWFSPDAPRIPGIRVLNHWMVLLRAVTQMLEYRDDQELESVADRCLDAVMCHHLNPEYNLLNEVLTHNYGIPDNEFSQYIYLGHGSQILWMVMHEANRRKDSDLFQKARVAFRRHVTVARDAVYGGYFQSLDHVGKYIWNLDKVLPAQEEVQIGNLFLIEHTGDEWAVKCFAEQEDYIREKFVRNGYMFWIDYGDRKVSEYRATRAENYHHPRYLMLNLLSLERMISRGGRITGMFGL